MKRETIERIWSLMLEGYREREIVKALGLPHREVSVVRDQLKPLVRRYDSHVQLSEVMMDRICSALSRAPYDPNKVIRHGEYTGGAERGPDNAPIHVILRAIVGDLKATAPIVDPTLRCCGV